MNNMEHGNQSDADLSGNDSQGAQLNEAPNSERSFQDVARSSSKPEFHAEASSDPDSEAIFLRKSEAYGLSEGSQATQQVSALPMMRPLDMTRRADEPQVEEDAKEKKKRKPLSLVGESLILFFIAMLLFLGLRGYVTQVYEIKGDSMLPTLEDGQKVMISKLSNKLDGLKAGDIIIFSDPDNPQRDLIKRVIALPGQRVEISHSNQVSVDGVPLAEKYVLRGGKNRGWSHSDEIVGQHEIWVMGDNRGNSKDSRRFGPIQQESIRGKVIFRLWPFDQLSMF